MPVDFFSNITNQAINLTSFKVRDYIHSNNYQYDILHPTVINTKIIDVEGSLNAEYGNSINITVEIPNCPSQTFPGQNKTVTNLYNIDKPNKEIKALLQKYMITQINQIPSLIGKPISIILHITQKQKGKWAGKYRSDDKGNIFYEYHIVDNAIPSVIPMAQPIPMQNIPQQNIPNVEIITCGSCGHKVNKSDYKQHVISDCKFGIIG